MILVSPQGPRTNALAAALGDAVGRRVDPGGDLGVGEASVLVYDDPFASQRAAEMVERWRWALASIGESFTSGRVRHVVVISSAAAYPPNESHPGMVDEERPPSPSGNRVAEAWQTLEEVAAEILPADGLTILRPSTVAVPGGEDILSQALDSQAALVPAGFDPTVQLLAVGDLAAAVRAAVEHEAGGVFHVAPPSGRPLRVALRRAGTRRLPLPFFTGGSSDEWDYLRYSWTVSGEKMRRELGFKPVARPEAFDDFGRDKAYVDRLGKTLFRFLHDAWWRVEHAGLDNVPRQGRAVLVGVHRGHQPWDGVMLLHLLAREIRRYPRFLIHPSLAKFPFLTPYMIKCGGVHACRENAARILDNDELLGVFPEGIRGAFRRYNKDIYKIDKKFRDDFVRFALRHRAPIVPFVTVGSAEIFPIFGRVDWGWWKRFSLWPYLPITPTMSTVPLPSKWHTRFLEPIHVEQEYDPEAADDAEIVRMVSRGIRDRMQKALDEMVRRRRHIFFGSIFEEAA